MTRTETAARRRTERRRAAERRELLDALGAARTQIRQAWAGFNSARDGELIESYVFEINALQCRYNYLLRRCKDLEEAPEQ